MTFAHIRKATPARNLTICWNDKDCKKSHPLEVNPWFNYYVARDGSRSALKEALHPTVGRWTMTHPLGTCACGEPLWFRPLVASYLCYNCSL